MAPNYWLLQLLTVSSLLVAPIQSLQSSLSTSPLRLSQALVSSSHFTPPSGRITPVSFSLEKNAPCTRTRNNKRQNRHSSHLFSRTNEIESDEDFDEFMEELLEESVAESPSSSSVEESDVAGKEEESLGSIEGVTDNNNTEETGKKGEESSPSIEEETDTGKTEVKELDSPHFIQRETAIGIGGNDGFVYDVNALKRNLVQESVRGCKQELLVLLGDGRQNEAITQKTRDGKEKVVVQPRWRKDRDDLIEERLSALVQANPVSTTTDSNLLDGEWSFAFATHSASTILDTSRFLLSKTKRFDSPAASQNEGENDMASSARGGPWRFRAGKTDNPFRSSTREIYLENLSGDENAHVNDETRVLGGLFQTSRRYDVFGLTRTALDLDLMESESKLFGFRVKGNNRDDFKGTKQGQPLEIQVLYLDSDLCICTTGAGLYGPLHVYTKSDLWVTGRAKRKLRLIAKTASWLSTMQSPLRIRQRLSYTFTKTKDSGLAVPSPEVKAINIGEVDINDDGKTREDKSWDGPDDPFMHLSPNERMEVLRTMSLQDIYQSASERKEQNKQQKKKKWVGSRGKKFKRPDL